MNKNIAIAIILSVALISCTNIKVNSDGSPQGGMGGQDSKTFELDDGKISLITRDYLMPNKKEYPFYKFYSYLIFLDKSSSTLEKRRAASEAYLCQFTSREEIEKIQLNLEDLAVFYAPLKNDNSARIIGDSTSISKFLDQYSYGYSQAFKASLGNTLSGGDFALGIVASPQPLYMGNNNVPINQIQVLNLTDLPPSQIGMVIKSYRKLVTGDYSKKVVDIILEVDPVSGRPSKIEKRKIPILEPITKIDMATKFRSVFSSIGKMFMLSEALASDVKDCI